MSKGEAPDSRGLIREAYRIEGITEGECRSIFLDWALVVEGEVAPAIDILLARHAADAPDHPMTRVLRDGLAPQEKPRRRGGWRRQDR
ncbi:MAG: hypothetical protein EP318_10720 [Rhodobacteraceae bacterium]|nr:MAG: hypothetical protein EP318_10720 [Paracoccaceae bacterium]